MKLTKGLSIGIVIVIVCLMNLSPLYAHHFTISFDFTMGVPLGDFNQNLENPLMGPGVDLMFVVKLGKLPLIVGIGGGMLVYGGDWREADVFIPEFGTITLDVHNSYEMYRAYTFLRFSPFENSQIRPYIDANLGWVWMSSITSIPGPSYGDDTSVDIARVLNLSESAICYGVGAGLFLRVAGKRNHNKSGWKSEYGIQFSIHYQHLPAIEYMSKGSVVVEGDEVIHRIYESEVDFLKISLGFNINF